MTDKVQYQVFDVKSLKIFPDEKSDEILRGPGFKQTKSRGAEKFNPVMTNKNFEIIGGQVSSVMTRMSIPQRIKENLNRRGIVNPNDQMEYPSRRTVAHFMFSGTPDTMRKLAFGDNEHKFWDPINKDIINWALDIYNFMIRKYGKENIVAFVVHVDEFNPDAHCIVLPISSENKFSWAWMFAGTNKWSYREYMNRLNDELAEVYNKYGMQRGEHHKKNNAYNFITEYEREILEKEYKACEAKLEPLQDERYHLQEEKKRIQTTIRSMTTMIRNLEVEMEQAEGNAMAGLDKKIKEKKDIKNDADRKLKELKERDISLAKQIVDLENKKSDLEQRLLEDENREKLALRLMERTLWVLAREEAIENEEKIRTFEQRLNDHQKKLFQKTFQGLPISRTMKVDADLIRVAVDLFFGYIESANRFLAEKGLPTYKPSEDSVRQEGESDDDWRSRCWRTALRLMNPTIEV